MTQLDVHAVESEASRERVEKESILLTKELKSWWVYKVMGPMERFCRLG